MYTLKSAWEEFEKICLKGVVGQQHREAKMAFYAGMGSLMKLQHAAGGNVTSDKEKAAVIQGWSVELEEFARLMFDGSDQNVH